MDDRDKEHAEPDPAGMQRKLARSRTELDRHAAVLEELAQELQLASAAKDPVSMTHFEVKAAISSLNTIKTLTDAAHVHLLRNETNEDKSKEDAVARKKLHKLWNQSYAAATSLQCTQEARQKIHWITKEVKGLEELRMELPSQDHSKAAFAQDTQIAELQTLLNQADLPPDHPRWASCDDLANKIRCLHSAPITPSDTKDFAKIFSKRDPYKISDLVVPKFNGKIENWISFWEEFVNAKTDMDECTKLVYLKQAILDPGLKQTVADLGIKDKAYPAALKLLHSRFNKPRIIHRQCCEELKSIPTNKDTRVGLTELADKGQHILTGLTRLESLGASEIISSMLELSMSKDLRHQWFTHSAELTKTPSADDLIAYIRIKADQAEGEEHTAPTKQSAEKSRNKSAHHKQRGSNHVASAPPTITPAAPVAAATVNAPPQQTGGTPQQAKSSYSCKYPCPLCPEKHFPYHCRVFEGYSPAQKNQHARTHSLCMNCLKPGHTAEVCRSTYLQMQNLSWSTQLSAS